MFYLLSMRKIDNSLAEATLKFIFKKLCCYSDFGTDRQFSFIVFSIKYRFLLDFTVFFRLF